MADDVAFRSMIRASGLGEEWTHTTDEQKFQQYGWRTTTKEDCYSPVTLVGNWNEEKFDISKVRVPPRLPSQFGHYFETTHNASYTSKPRRVPKEILHLAEREPRAFPASQPELDQPELKAEYNSFQTTSEQLLLIPS
ncbi:putative UPF0686 protein C11orf1-like [Apostichopus japonicus]|uniref:Putative UPF0686 protein C11orf1-like n=1 Tax=Stichopus japonicus TaxID=307972 RepID=A0A2G8KGH3_STIJA|nr:putative UPF0686 protein C11orf1-like [Apostichopus japonicus]